MGCKGFRPRCVVLALPLGEPSSPRWKSDLVAVCVEPEEAPEPGEPGMLAFGEVALALGLGAVGLG